MSLICPVVVMDGQGEDDGMLFIIIGLWVALLVGIAINLLDFVCVVFAGSPTVSFLRDQLVRILVSACGDPALDDGDDYSIHDGSTDSSFEGEDSEDTQVDPHGPNSTVEWLVSEKGRRILILDGTWPIDR